MVDCLFGTVDRFNGTVDFPFGMLDGFNGTVDCPYKTLERPHKVVVDLCSVPEYRF